MRTTKKREKKERKKIETAELKKLLCTVMYYASLYVHFLPLLHNYDVYCARNCLLSFKC